MTSLSTYITVNMGIAPEDKPLAISGRNWGDAVLEGFLLFTISLLGFGLNFVANQL
jgi:hypothetical protein